MRRPFARSALLFSLAAGLLAGCGDPQEPPPVDAGVVDAGEPDAGAPPARTPPEAALASVDLTGLPGETSVSLSWSWNYLGPVTGVERWVVDYGEQGTGYPHTFEVGAAEPLQATLEGLEADKTYEIYVSGLTATGFVAPPPDETGERPAGSYLAQSTPITVTTGTPRFGPARQVLAGALDSPILLPLDSRSSVLVYRTDRDLYVSTSDDRGGSFGQGMAIDTFVTNVRAALDRQRGIVAVCYNKAEGIYLATSTNRGRSFATQLLAEGKGPGCSVSFAAGGFLVAVEDQAAGEILVHRSEDGSSFGAAVLGAEVTNPGSCAPAIVADPEPRVVGGQQAQMVYLSWVQQRTTGTGGTDIFVSSSRDGGHSFVTDGGHVVGMMVNEPVVSAETNPTLAVDPENGRLWIAWEDRKTTPLVLLAISEDFCQSRPSGALSWKVGEDLSARGHERVNPSLRVRPGGKLLVAFASGPRANSRTAYLTQFDVEADGGRGRFEPPQTGAEVSLALGVSPLAADTRDTSELAGPMLAADPLIGEYAVWATNAHTIQGDLEIALSPAR